VALALVLVQIHACGAQASVMDKDGDGVVTPEEFVEHAQAQEVIDCDQNVKMLRGAKDRGACSRQQSTRAHKQWGEDARLMLNTWQACAAGACAAEEDGATLRGSEDEEAAAGAEMPSAEQIAAARAEVAAQFASGKAVKMSHDNTVAILDGTQHVLLKFSTSWCGHCVKMEPDWQRLAKLVHKDYKGCMVVSVDCEATADICQVNRFPCWLHCMHHAGEALEGSASSRAATYSSRHFPSLLTSKGTPQ
jgi:thiol-disulfide isomerase/thioredoxin